MKTQYIIRIQRTNGNEQYFMNTLAWGEKLIPMHTNDIQLATRYNSYKEVKEESINLSNKLIGKKTIESVDIMSVNIREVIELI